MSRVDRPGVTVRALGDGELPAAIGVLARGMRDNPGHVAAFGNDPARRQRGLERMFTALFSVMRNLEPSCAVEGRTIVGFAAVAPPGTCRSTAAQKAQMAARLTTLGPGTLRRIIAWQGVWRAHDPDEPHSHFGPLAVDAHLQGRGVGSALLRAYTGRLDAAGEAAYLETDKPENVAFYERHGFVVTGEAVVLGNPNWFMRRPPAKEHGPA